MRSIHAVAFGCPLLDVQDLLQLFAKVYVGDVCLLAENITGYAHQFPFLAFLLFFTWFLAPVGVHSGFLVPSEQHQRHVQRASVSHFQGFHYRLRGFFVLLDGKDGRRLALQFAAQMPAQQPLGTKCSTHRMQVL